MSPPAEQRLLSAAVDGLVQLDPSALAVQAICRRASVTAPSLYHHYGNKDGLIAAAVASLADTWLTLLDSSVPQTDDLQQMLDSAASNWEAMVLAPERPLAVFAWVSLLTAPESEQASLALQRAVQVGEDLVVGRLRPFLPQPGRAEAIAELAVSSLIGIAVQYRVDADPVKVRQRLAAVTDSVQRAR